MPDETLVLPGSVDTHCHTAPMTAKGMDTETLLQAARQDGMRTIVDVGLLPEDLTGRRDSLAAYPWVVLTSGMHPSEVERADIPDQLKLLESQAANGEIVAIGEVGLDYHWDTGSRKAAIALLERQVVIAVATGLPVIVHNREADADVLGVLARHRPRGLMHCFSQDVEFCRRCVDLGLHISFGGNLTYKRSDKIREAARFVPADRLLVETDSPYLSPEPVRGRPNHPGHLGFTIAALAALRAADPEQVSQDTADNAGTLFRL